MKDEPSLDSDVIPPAAEVKPSTMEIKTENGEQSSDGESKASIGSPSQRKQRSFTDPDDIDMRCIFSLPPELSHIMATWPKVRGLL